MKIKTELYEIDIHKKQLKYDFLFIALIFGTALTFNMLKKKKKNDKFGILGKPELNGILKWQKKVEKNEAENSPLFL